MAKFLTFLDDRKTGPQEWTLLAPLRYLTDVFNALSLEVRFLIEQIFPGFIIEAPTDFKTDYGSIPQVAQIVISKVGPWDEPCVIHDFGYRTQPPGITRAQWDAILMEGMKAKNVSWRKRWEIYLSVRVGGWVSWNRNKKKLEAAG